MSNKHLDENTIANELKGSSLFFHPTEDSPIIESSPKDPSKAIVDAATAPPQDTGTFQTAHHVSPVQDSPQSPTTVLDDPAEKIASIPASPQIPSQPSTSPSGEAKEEIHREQKIVGPDERSNERRKVRHSFDILSDQLFALRELAVERERFFGRKVLIGDLVQEALDMFIAKERNQE